jgi:hypothetical protein
MGVVSLPGAWLPNAFVGISPLATNVLAKAAEQTLRLAVETSAVSDELNRSVDDLPVDVELQLLGGGVSNSDGA